MLSKFNFAVPSPTEVHYVHKNMEWFSSFEIKENLWKLSTLSVKFNKITIHHFLFVHSTTQRFATWEHAEIPTQLSLWSALSNGLCHQFSLLTSLVLCSPTGRRQQVWRWKWSRFGISSSNAMAQKMLISIIMNNLWARWNFICYH